MFKKLVLVSTTVANCYAMDANNLDLKNIIGVNSGTYQADVGFVVRSQSVEDLAGPATSPTVRPSVEVVGGNSGCCLPFLSLRMSRVPVVNPDPVSVVTLQLNPAVEALTPMILPVEASVLKLQTVIEVLRSASAAREITVEIAFDPRDSAVECSAQTVAKALADDSVTQPTETQPADEVTPAS